MREGPISFRCAAPSLRGHSRPVRRNVRVRMAAAWMIATALACQLVMGLGSSLAGFEPYVKPLTFHNSFLTCNITTMESSMCVMTNAYYRNRTIYFLTDDPKQVSLFIPHFSLPRARPMPPGLFKVVNKDELQAIMSAPVQGAEANNKILQYTKGILYYRLYADNFYHTFWEGVNNIHMLACKIFGKCQYDPSEKELQLFFFDELDANLALHHAHLYKCITSLDYEQMAAPHLPLPARIWRLTVGLGPEGFGQGQVISKRSLPSLEVRTHLIQRMRSCMDLPPVPPTITGLKSPIMTIIQRPRGYRGRAISNLEEVVQWVSELMPGFEVQVVHMEGLSLQAQAEVWSKATVVMSNHGAQLSNVMYMRNNSFLIEVEQYRLRYYLYRTRVVQPMGPYVNIGHAFVSPTNLSSVNVSNVEGLKQQVDFAALPPAEQQSWIDHPDCWREWSSPKLGGICRGTWTKFYTDVILEKSMVVAAITEALNWVKKHSLQLNGSK